MNLISIFKYGAKLFKAPPKVLGVINDLENIYNELTAKGYSDNNPPPASAISEVLNKFDISREDIKNNLHLLDRSNRVTNAINTFAPGVLNSVKNYANDFTNKGDTGNSAVTHNTITGRRKLPKIR